MSYTSGEALVLSTLVGISGSVWASSGAKKNAGVGLWKLLNTGNSDHYAILYPGSGTNRFHGFDAVERTYTTIIEVWQRYKDDGTSVTNLEGYFEAILQQFDKYRKLGDTGGTINDSYISKWDEPQEQWRQGGEGPSWISQKFYVEWKEQETVAFAE